MAKKGMKRPERTHTQPRNEVQPVPEIQGKAKHGKAQAAARYQNTFDNDLAKDNMTNDTPDADLQD